MLDTLPAAERPGAVEARTGALRTVAEDAYAPTDTAFYVYRLRRGDDEHVGVVGEVGHEAFLDRRVRGHEAVQPRRVEGLVEHFSSAAVRSELVALLHRPGPEVVAVVDQAVGADPVLTFTGPDDWEQTVWRVPGAAATCSPQSSAGACTTSPTATTGSPRAWPSGRSSAGRTTRA